MPELLTKLTYMSNNATYKSVFLIDLDALDLNERTRQTHMSNAIPYYYKSLDWDKLIEHYPPPPLYGERVRGMSEEAVYEMQNSRFMARVTEAWDIPFYRERWKAAGLEPGDIRSLDDIQKIPTFNSDDFFFLMIRRPP